ncbi:MAG TPA: MlaD family protein [Aeromicrobium sp.]|nr:MlaD family protein [Aeromicrobium sp.]
MATRLDRRNTRLAEIVLIVIALIGVLYLGDSVIGSNVFSSKHEVTVKLANGGGIYPGADVTYRGNSVGRVDRVFLDDGGVTVELHVKGDVDIPTDTEAAVSNLSAIGEQRIDFRPRVDHGPFLRDGDVVEATNTSTPRRFDDIVTHLGDVADRIDPEDITTITTELGDGLNTRTDLVALGRDANRVLTLLENLQPRFDHLVQQSQVPLRGIVDSGSDLRTFAKNIDLVTASMKASDGDIRHALDSTSSLTPKLATSIRQLTDPLTSSIASWNAFAKLGDDRLEGYQHWLRWAPDQFYAMADATRDGSGHVLMVANFGDNCPYGPPRVTPFAMTHDPAPSDQRCTVEKAGVQQRGTQYAPRLPGDPEP